MMHNQIVEGQIIEDYPALIAQALVGQLIEAQVIEENRQVRQTKSLSFFTPKSFVQVHATIGMIGALAVNHQVGCNRYSFVFSSLFFATAALCSLDGLMNFIEKPSTKHAFKAAFNYVYLITTALLLTEFTSNSLCFSPNAKPLG